MPVYFLKRERKVQMEGEGRRNWEELEEGNCNQNILIKKICFQWKKNTKETLGTPSNSKIIVCSHLPNILEISEMWKWTQKIKHRKPNKAEHSGMYSASHRETQNLHSRLSYCRACLYQQRTMEAEQWAGVRNRGGSGTRKGQSGGTLYRWSWSEHWWWW